MTSRARGACNRGVVHIAQRPVAYAGVAGIAGTGRRNMPGAFAICIFSFEGPTVTGSTRRCRNRCVIHCARQEGSRIGVTYITLHGANRHVRCTLRNAGPNPAMAIGTLAGRAGVVDKYAGRPSGCAFVTSVALRGRESRRVSGRKSQRVLRFERSHMTGRALAVEAGVIH